MLGRSTALPINEGSRNTYTVGLNVAPAGNVVVRVLWSDDGAVKVNKTGGTAASHQDLTFTPSGAGIWSTNQTVTLVKEHDDDMVDESVTITASVMDADTQDTNYDDASAKTFTVRLGSKPTADVVIDVSSGDTGEGTVSPLQLRFTPMNWNQTQTVTVTGVNEDGDVAWQVRLGPASSDPDYNGLTNVDTTDNDTAGVVVAPTMWTLKEQYPSAGSGTYTVVLAAQPAGPVTVDATVVSSTTATVGPTESPTLRRLVFMAGNWATAQTVTDGNTAEGSALITHTPVTGYSGVTSGPLVPVSEDEDIPLVVGSVGAQTYGWGRW